ncbi:MAG: c-type cytochrome [Pseudomonadota bacterium]|nr:c-type cytochrome [Pseudomonadota bacterium]
MKRWLYDLRNVISLTALIISSTLIPNNSMAGTVEDGIISRIQAVGNICIEGHACAEALVAAPTGPRSAEEVYNSGCMACHTSGAAGAPTFRDATAWSTRLAKGLDTLYSNAINGIGAMPAKGLCPTCSDEEIEIAVDYMLEGI